MKLRIYIMTAVMILLAICPLWGQEQKPDQQTGEAPVAAKSLLGGFETEGSVTGGYRFVDVAGNRAQYDDLFDLRKGFRVLNLNLMSRAAEGSNLFADSYSFTANGMGGDPYQMGQFTLRKDKVYDLRVNYRQSYYYWSQNNTDSQVMAGLGVPVGLGGSPSGYTNGLTANHGWATVRRIGSMDYSVRATDHLQFNVEYERNSRNGMTQTTRTLYFPGNSTSATGAVTPGWGGFSTANPYLMAAPLDELGNRITGGISYRLGDWAIHYRAGYQSFSQNTIWNNLDSPEQSINTSTNVFTAKPPNINSLTSQELLNSASWSESRRLSTPVSELFYSGKVNNWLELRGGYNYYHYAGPDTTDASFVGNARTTSAATAFAPYAASLNARAHVDQPSHDVNQGLTAKIREWWKFHADYRYSRITTDGINEYGSFYNTVAAVPGTDETEWRIGTHQVDLSMEFIPASSLVIRTGIRYIKRDVEQLEDGVVNMDKAGTALNGPTQRTKNVWPTLSVFYRPIKKFSMHGDFQTNTTSKPYTRISAHTDRGSRFVFRYQPSDKLSIEDNLIIRNSRFVDSSYSNRYRSNALNVFYSVNRQFSFNGGYSYENLFSTAAHVRPNATTPFNGFWQDAFVNRGFRGGIVIRPAGRFGLDVSGNFLRTTGASRLFSSAPASALSGLPIVWPVDVGPLTFPLATGTLYYDFRKAGRLAVDVQRTYYIEQLVRGNNFQANLLTIRWTKSLGTSGGE